VVATPAAWSAVDDGHAPHEIEIEGMKSTEDYRSC
jgi:hypothetical protein